MILHLNTQLFNAVSVFAAKNDIRYYLNGVHVEVVKGAAFLVATNGHAMAWARHEVEGADDGVVFVPQAAFSLISKAKALGSFTVSLGPTGTVEVRVGGNTLRVEDVEHYRYPDWRRIVPDLDWADLGNGGQTPSVSATYLAALVKAGKALGRSRPSNDAIRLRTYRPHQVLAAFHGEPNFGAVIEGQNADKLDPLALPKVAP